MSTPQLPSFRELYDDIGLHLEEGHDPLLSFDHEARSQAYLATLTTNSPEACEGFSNFTKGKAAALIENAEAAWEILHAPEEIIRYQAVLTWQAVENLRANGGSQQEIDGLTGQLAKQVAKWNAHYPNEVRAVAREMHNPDGTPRFTEAELHPEGEAPNTHGDVIDVQATEVPPAPIEHVDLSNDNLGAAPETVASAPAAPAELDLSNDGLAASQAEPTTPAADASPTGEPAAPIETAASEIPSSEAATSAQTHGAAPAAEPANPPVSESRALTLVESTAEKTAAAEAKSHTRTGMIIAAIVGAVGIGAAAWRNREKSREAETSRTR